MNHHADDNDDRRYHRGMIHSQRQKIHSQRQKILSLTKIMLKKIRGRVTRRRVEALTWEIGKDPGRGFRDPWAPFLPCRRSWTSANKKSWRCYNWANHPRRCLLYPPSSKVSLSLEKYLTTENSLKITRVKMKTDESLHLVTKEKGGKIIN